MVGILVWSSEDACCTSFLRKRLSIQILVLSRPLPGFGQSSYIQIRLMGNLCLNGGIPWFFNTEGSLCFICKENTETVYHHFIECPPFMDNYSSLWSNLKTKIINFNQIDGITISDFITNLDPHKKFYNCWGHSVFLFMILQ